MRRLALALALLLPGMALAQTPTTATLASVFVDSIGIVGTDVPNTALLSQIGVRHVRIGAGPNGASAAQILAWGAGGAKVDVLYKNCYCNITPATLASWVATYIDPAIAVVDAIEGEDEVNGGATTDTYNGVCICTQSGAAAYQAALDAAVKADATAAAVPVMTYSLVTSTSSSGWTVPASSADISAEHCYGHNIDSAAADWQFCATIPPLAASRPVMITETGMTTIPNQYQGTDETTQARYDLRFGLFAFTQGTARTYVFSLADFTNDGRLGGAPTTDYQAYYGAFYSNGLYGPKVLANALRNLITTLGGNLAYGSLGSPGSLSFALTGMPGSSYSLLLQEPGPPPGVWDLVIWRDGDSWNSSAAAPQSLGTASVTLTLASPAGSIGVFDPIVSSGALQSLAGASAITVALSDDPLILKILPVTGGRLAAAGPFPRTERHPL